MFASSQTMESSSDVRVMDEKAPVAAQSGMAAAASSLQIVYGPRRVLNLILLASPDYLAAKCAFMAAGAMMTR